MPLVLPLTLPEVELFAVPVALVELWGVAPWFTVPVAAVELCGVAHGHGFAAPVVVAVAPWFSVPVALVELWGVVAP